MFFDYWRLQLGKAGMAIFVAVMALALAACGGGGGGDDASGAEKPASKQSFIQQADAICAKGQQRVTAELNAFLKKKGIKKNGEGQSPSEAKANELEVAEEIGIPALHRQIDEIEALEAPHGEDSNVKAYFDALDAEIKRVEKNPQLLFGLPAEPFRKSARAAKKIGFTVCGNH